MEPEEAQTMIRDYQQRLADATFQAVQVSAKLATAQQRIKDLEADTGEQNKHG